MESVLLPPCEWEPQLGLGAHRGLPGASHPRPPDGRADSCLTGQHRPPGQGPSRAWLPETDSQSQPHLRGTLSHGKSGGRRFHECWGAPDATSQWEEGITFRPPEGWSGQRQPHWAGSLVSREPPTHGTHPAREPPGRAPAAWVPQRGTSPSLPVSSSPASAGSVCGVPVHTPGPEISPSQETVPLTVTSSSIQRQGGLLPTLQSPRTISAPPGPPGAPRAETAPPPPRAALWAARVRPLERRVRH